jgi:hypothetical protein
MRYALDNVILSPVKHTSGGGGALESLTLIYGTVSVEPAP